MTLEQLANLMHTDTCTLLVRVTELNRKYELDILDLNNLSQNESDTLRALTDPWYLVQLIRPEKGDTRYNYVRTPGYRDTSQWVGEQNLDGWSTKDIMKMVPQGPSPLGAQTVAAVMKNKGYESAVVMLEETGKQGRRWFKEVSFL